MMEDKPRRSQLTMVLYSVSGKSEEVDGTMEVSLLVLLVLFMVVVRVWFVKDGFLNGVTVFQRSGIHKNNDGTKRCFVCRKCSEGARIWFRCSGPNDFRMVCVCV